MQLARMRPVVVAIHWPHFGPYHLARLRAARASLKDAQIDVVGLEIASHYERYFWREEAAGDLTIQVVFPGRIYERISPFEMQPALAARLKLIRPDVIAICGYSTSDALGLLVWCRRHGRPTILMSDSTADDRRRSGWKEWLKRRLVAQYSAGLCAGRPQRRYLEQLGMESEQIFEGIDVVDNDYFSRGAERARLHRSEYLGLPGLQSPEPFFLASARFLKDKNLDGLLRAYAAYRRRLIEARDGHTPWRLVILGDGDERPALERLVYAEDIQGVSFPGFRQLDELPIYFGLASVFIHPTRHETWGLVVNEAMAAGLPVLVSNRCGCVPDLISEGANGFTFSPDDMTMLTDLMLRTSSGMVDLCAMGAASHNRIREWGLERFAQGLHGAVQVALGTGHPAGEAGRARDHRR
jgi:1,2-diacylglycerol 3-alpha-glucosyltransferase